MIFFICSLLALCIAYRSGYRSNYPLSYPSTLFTAEPVSLQLDYVFFMISGGREMQLFMKSALTMPDVYGNLPLFLSS